MDYKGIGLVFVRTALRNAGPAAEKKVLDELTPEELRIYEDATASQWVPITLATRLFELSAPVLHPGKPLALRLVGRDLARDNMQGAYRIFLRVLTPKFLLEQTARVWSTYHRHGTSHVVVIGPNEVDVIVEDYPRLPERFRECMCGWMSEAIGLTGAKLPFVTKHDENPRAWRWRLRWQ